MLQLIKTHFCPIIQRFASNSLHSQLPFSNSVTCFRSLSSLLSPGTLLRQNNHNSLSRHLLPVSQPQIDISRNVTKFSLKTGKKRSVYAVLTRFYRLQNGLWIRRRAACHKKLHQRTEADRWGKEQHVVCTRTQCIMFDKMVTNYHKRKRYFIDDPFEPYQVRNNFKYVLPHRRT